MSKTIQKTQKQTNEYLIISILFVLLIGWIFRGIVQFSTDLAPGINGAYYPVQVRSIFQTGNLSISDFPFYFYLQALISYLPWMLGGDPALLMSTRIIDVIIPILIAIPSILIVKSLLKKQQNQAINMIVYIVVGLFAVLNGSLLRMLGDFQKNASALPLALLFLYFFFIALERPNTRNLIYSGIFLVLTLSTHVGAAGMTLLLTFLTIFLYFLFDPKRKKIFYIILGLIIVLGITFSLIYLFDPTRVERLIGSSIDPAELFKNAVITRWFSPKGNLQESRFGLNDAAMLIALGLGIFGLILNFSKRKKLSPAQKSILLASSLTAILFAAPIFNPSYSIRFTYMAFVPAIIPLAFIVTHIRFGSVIGMLFLILELCTNTYFQISNPQQTITLEAYEELQSLRDDIPEDGSLVYARHGLEWWVAWTMQTKVTNRMDVVEENWDEYSSFFVVDELGTNAFEPVRRISNQKMQIPKINDDEKLPPKGQPPQMREFPADDAQQKNPHRIPTMDIEALVVGEFFQLSKINSIPIKEDILEEPINIQIISRQEWNARPMNFEAEHERGVFNPKSNPTGIMIYNADLAQVLDAIVVHHSALAPDIGVSEIQSLHMDKRGFADIGYHFVIDHEGLIFEGRPLNIRGTHTKDHNTGSIGIVLTGNFEQNEPPTEQIASLNNLISFLSETFSIQFLSGHKDLNPVETVCPGEFLYQLIPEIAVTHDLEYMNE